MSADSTTIHFETLSHLGEGDSTLAFTAQDAVGFRGPDETRLENDDRARLRAEIAATTDVLNEIGDGDIGRYQALVPPQLPMITIAASQVKRPPGSPDTTFSFKPAGKIEPLALWSHAAGGINTNPLTNLPFEGKQSERAILSSQSSDVDVAHVIAQSIARIVSGDNVQENRGLLEEIVVRFDSLKAGEIRRAVLAEPRKQGETQGILEFARRAYANAGLHKLSDANAQQQIIDVRLESFKDSKAAALEKLALTGRACNQAIQLEWAARAVALLGDPNFALPHAQTPNIAFIRQHLGGLEERRKADMTVSIRDLPKKLLAGRGRGVWIVSKEQSDALGGGADTADGIFAFLSKQTPSQPIVKERIGKIFDIHAAHPNSELVIVAMGAKKPGLIRRQSTRGEALAELPPELYFGVSLEDSSLVLDCAKLKNALYVISGDKWKTEHSGLDIEAMTEDKPTARLLGALALQHTTQNEAWLKAFTLASQVDRKLMLELRLSDRERDNSLPSRKAALGIKRDKTTTRL
jgi:hypothetical protein